MWSTSEILCSDPGLCCFLVTRVHQHFLSYVEVAISMPCSGSLISAWILGCRELAPSVTNLCNWEASLIRCGMGRQPGLGWVRGAFDTFCVQPVFSDGFLIKWNGIHPFPHYNNLWVFCTNFFRRLFRDVHWNVRLSCSTTLSVRLWYQCVISTLSEVVVSGISFLSHIHRIN